MSVFVISIHIDCPNYNNWRDLQKRFISSSAGDIQYGIIVNGRSTLGYTNIVHHVAERTSHLNCIKIALDLFRSSRHDHLLLLDSDCWPIRDNWVDILSNILGDRYLYAAPVRTENFDLFPHPCAFYMCREFLKHVNFNHTIIDNMIGISISDVGSGMPQYIDNKLIWHPLLKTNYISPHPVYASIYGDMFYHHCAGSRGIGFRASKYNFYNHIMDKKEHMKIYEKATTNLLYNPCRYIDKLRGIGVIRGD